MNKDIVSLEGMEFYAFHGFYAEEREKGNDFVVDVHVTTDFSVASESDNLEGTVNYEEIYTITKEEMSISTKLLERLGQRILDRLFEAFSTASAIEISVAKKNPPVGGQVNRSRITMIRTRE
ncbi:dihydroneopterin aldolase [Roseivirga misakiensis]|uniref:7,8-dihydroneopterin aldolase n=1 Tax=Roseivirga misakiensis TaxID=1563681 RepID=A0A1E5SKH9_9BACT|nr:dihydroneopterin aldolase [Roseivirga misakiensis]OEJ99629.1 dihydroneopterin aldolase [Roseivirga misakiensis]